MKKTIATILILAIIMGLAGCGASSDPAASDQSSIEYLQGTWDTASMGYEYYGESQAEYYVRFTDTEIIYGHMKGDEFVPDHANKIDSIEELDDGRYRIRAMYSSGEQYTYQSSESDSEYIDGFDVLNYYWTWDEDEFSSSYSAGSSLWKSKE